MSKRRRKEGRSRPATDPGHSRSTGARAAEGGRRDRPSPRRRIAALPPAVLATAAVLLLLLAGGAFWVTRPAAAPVAPAGGVTPVVEQVAARVDATGRLLLPLDGNLAVVSLPDRGVSEVVQSGRSGAVTDARWSPDHKSVAYALYHVKLGDTSASSEIYLTDLAGEPRVLVERDRPGAVVDSPSWSPDGAALYFGYSTLDNQRLVRRIERFEVATGTRTPVTEGALPTVSPDGGSLAMIRSDSSGDSLVVSRSDGSEPKTLVPSGRFSVLGAARFSPDGRTLAIPVSAPGGRAGKASPGGLYGQLLPPVALAHGDPWDVVLVPAEGGEPQRLTNLLEDEITVAWSSDGSQLAVYGTRGLYLSDRQGRTTFVLDRGGYGGIDWAP